MENDIFIVNWNKSMIIMWINSTIYFDFSHVAIYYLCEVVRDRKVYYQTTTNRGKG